MIVSIETPNPPEETVTIGVVKDTVGPAGEIVVLKKTLPAKVLRLETVIVEFAEDPRATATWLAVAVRLKSGPAACMGGIIVNDIRISSNAGSSILVFLKKRFFSLFKLSEGFGFSGACNFDCEDLFWPVGP